MRRTANGSAADEFAAVRERWLAAQAERDQAAAAVEQAKAVREERLAEPTQALAFGDLDVSGYEAAKAEIDAEVAKVEGALERTEAVVAALAKRAIELETSIVSAHEAEVRGALVTAQNEVDALEAKLASARRLAEELVGQLEDAVRQVAEAGAEFDPERAKAVSARRTQERDVIAWHVRNPQRIGEAPRQLREQIREAIEREHGAGAAAATFAAKETAPHYVRVA